MQNLTKKIMASAFALVLLTVAAVPMVQASHFTWYFSGAPEAHESMGTFESVSDTSPASGIPTAFQNLNDRLVTAHGYGGSGTPTAGDQGAMVLDYNFMPGPVAPNGNVPVWYYAAEYGDQSLRNRMTGTGSFWAWHGYWWDDDSDGVIDEVYYNGQGRNPNATLGDEWVWRGIGSGEPTTMVGYLFPSDRTVELGGSDGFFVPAWGDAGQTEPRGFAGNCNKYANEPNCWEPSPDISMADRTNNDAGQGNQQWLSESGWNDQFAEEDLITGLHVFGLVGGNSVTGPEKYDVDCSNSGDTCAHDYDYYEALAGQDVSDLYFTVMHPLRDDVWQNQTIFNNGVTGNVTGGYTIDRYRQEATSIDACPWKPTDLVCQQDTSHLDAEKDDTNASTDEVMAGVVATSATPFVTNVGGTFEQYWCNTATGGSSACEALTGHGVYGGYTDSPVETPDDVSSHEEGLFLAANAFAWRWTDDGDGYIGSPTQSQIDNYDAGLSNSPNNGFCTTGDVCELSGHATVFANKLVRMYPCEAPVSEVCSDGAWPPGSFVSRVYDRWSDGAPFTPTADRAWFEQSTPAFGGQPVDLRMDGQGCGGEAIACRSVDAVFVPGGSHATLDGVLVSVGSGIDFGNFTNGRSTTFAPGIQFSWDEGTTTYTKTYATLTDYAEAGALGLV